MGHRRCESVRAFLQRPSVCCHVVVVVVLRRECTVRALRTFLSLPVPSCPRQAWPGRGLCRGDRGPSPHSANSNSNSPTSISFLTFRVTESTEESTVSESHRRCFTSHCFIRQASIDPITASMTALPSKHKERLHLSAVRTSLVVVAGRSGADAASLCHGHQFRGSAMNDATMTSPLPIPM